MMDTKLWVEESDNYTARAIDLHGNNLYGSVDKAAFSKNAFEIISKFKAEPHAILDIGCAFGASIYALKEKFPETDFFGIDPGKESIQIAKKNLKGQNLHFTNGFSHELPYDDDKFDVVILSMVLQWIPRKYLIRTISEVDRVLKDGGIVYIQEFLTNKPVTSLSRHDDEIYIFKNDYASFFTAFPWLKEVYRELKEIEKGEDQQRYTSVVRKYAINEVYTSKTGAVESK